MFLRHFLGMSLRKILNQKIRSAQTNSLLESLQNRRTVEDMKVELRICPYQTQENNRTVVQWQDNDNGRMVGITVEQRHSRRHDSRAQDLHLLDSGKQWNSRIVEQQNIRKVEQQNSRKEEQYNSKTVEQNNSIIHDTRAQDIRLLNPREQQNSRTGKPQGT